VAGRGFNKIQRDKEQGGGGREEGEGKDNHDNNDNHYNNYNNYNYCNKFHENIPFTLVSSLFTLLPFLSSLFSLICPLN